MFKIVTPGSVTVEGRFMSIDRGSTECFINFIDGTTVRVSAEYNPGAFSKIMTAVTAVADSSKLMNAELNFINGRVILNSVSQVKKPSIAKPSEPTAVTVKSEESNKTSKKTSVTQNKKESTTAKKASIPPIGVKRVTRRTNA